MRTSTKPRKGTSLRQTASFELSCIFVRRFVRPLRDCEKNIQKNEVKNYQNKTSHKVVISRANAVAQGSVVTAMSASYGKSLYSTLRTNQTPYATTTKVYTIDNVGDLNRCANFHCNRLDMGAPPAYVKYNDFVTFLLLIVFF
jgi:hypothetical protein